MKRKRNEERLRYWQDRAAAAELSYRGELDRMDRREALYRGCREIKPREGVKRPEKTGYVRNICYELVESQVSSDIPMPKVTALRQGDEWRAKLIEDVLRDELDRLNMERMHDMQQRTVPIQGGSGWHTEWDNSRRTHRTVGEVVVEVVHPKGLLPQPGVTSDIEDMDYVILTIPQTKGGIRRRYGVDVSRESEERPELRSADGSADLADDMVTQYIVYYRAENGAIGRYSWVGNTVLEDYPDYLARRLRKCVQCGAPEPAEGDAMAEQTVDGTCPGGGPELPEDAELPRPRARPGTRWKRCPHCGGTKWEEQVQEYEEIWEEIALERPDGVGLVIPGAREILEPTGELDPTTGLPVTAFLGQREPTRIPYYKPDKYPIVLQRNVSQYGTFLGSSDIDVIEDQQLELNHLSQKIREKLDGAGDVITLPINSHIETDNSGVQVVYIENPADKSLIGCHTLQGNVSQDLAFREQVYEESRQAIGVTDSFQGRRDATATSGKAKEFSAAQTAGRLESKRIMENEAFARIYELIFKFKLAYADEPRPVVGNDPDGQRAYGEFNRWFFLERDEAGEWYWNDEFLFSVDTSAPLASNREAMWQETRSHFENGAFGDPASIDTRIIYWSKMELLHYPGAGDTVATLKEMRAAAAAQEQAQQRLIMQQQMIMDQSPAGIARPV